MESLRGGASQKSARGRGGLQAPWKSSRNRRVSGGRQPPSKSNLWQLFFVTCRGIIFLCQDFLSQAVPIFSVSRFLGPGPAMNLRVPGSVLCHGVPAGCVERGLDMDLIIPPAAAVLKE